jgi:hypothetical protein
VEHAIEVVEAAAPVSGSDSDGYREDLYLELAITIRRAGAEE